MASSFAITTITNSILLDEQRHGEAVFSVYNGSDRAIRGRAQLAAANAAARAWLSLAGAERDFAIHSIEQFVVQIAVPLDAPAGNYTFRLDMIGVEHPDEDFTQGPTVTFQVLPPPPPAKEFPRWLKIAAVVAELIGLVGLLIGIYSRSGAPIWIGVGILLGGIYLTARINLGRPKDPGAIVAGLGWIDLVIILAAFVVSRIVTSLFPWARF